MNYFDLYAGFLGQFSPLRAEIEREIIDVEYEDISDQVKAEEFCKSLPSKSKITNTAIDYADTDNK